MKTLINILVIILLFLSFSSYADNTLKKVNVSEDDYVLLSLKLNDEPIDNSMDSYVIDEALFFPIEPLLTALGVRYKLKDNLLLIWKNETLFEYFLSDNVSLNTLSPAKLWGDDGFNYYLSEKLVNQIFATEININLRTLSVNIKTSDYLFPYQIIQQQNKERLQAQYTGYYRKGGTATKRKVIDITIPDQYRLMTMPTGYLTASTQLDEKGNQSNIQASIVSDVLYHSAIVNVNKSSNEDIKGGVSFSKYKTSPENHILGVLDSYSFGDISYTGDATSLSTGGVGIQLLRQEKDYRKQNSVITLSENAPPGWEAELYHNKRFISTVNVPETGLLIYNDIEVFYGENEFIIKLFGPYGEKDQIKTTYHLQNNTLGKNDFAFGAYALDPLNSVFNNSAISDESASLNFSNIGGNLDYGITDRWQVGLSYSHRENNSQLNLENSHFVQDALTIKNALSFTGILVENHFSLNDDGGFLQKTTLMGNAIYNGSFNMLYESSHNYQTESVDSTIGDKNFDYLRISYFNMLGQIPINLSFDKRKTQTSDTYSIRNTLSYNVDGLFFRNNLSYISTSIENDNFNFENNTFSGAFSVAGALTDSLRISGTVNYEPEKSNPILDSSNINLNYTYHDPYDFRHYFSMNYAPLVKTSKWSASHNLAINVDQFQFGVVSRYAEDGRWSINANIRFFFGFDYHNNKMLFNNSLNTDSAQLNLHAYLDRHMNGVYDVLDYNLAGVTIPNIRQWDKLSTGENGKMIVPSVPVNQPFSFAAKWKDGAQMGMNNYTLYTHPGARVDVNMPLYLTTEFTGFISILRRGIEIGAKGLTVDLLGADGSILKSAVTDEDGYYEFVNIAPDNYIVKVNQQSLRENELSSDVIGFNLALSSIGGYLELPAIFLERTDEILEESVVILSIGENEVEPILWDENESKQVNYFNMPTKSTINVDPNLPVLPPKKSIEKTLKSARALVIEKSTLESLEQIKTIKLDKKLTSTKSVEKLGFTIQFAAFSTSEQAEVFKNNLSNKLGLVLEIKESKNSRDQTFYGVQYGSYTTRLEAKESVGRLALLPTQYMIKKTITLSMPSFVSNKKQIANLSDVTIVTPAKPLVKPIPIVENGWVIQYGSYKKRSFINSNILLNEKNNFFLAHKMLNKVTYYCLISKTFLSKEAAKDALKGNVGWITPLENFTNISKL